MPADPAVYARLDAWRTQGADRIDPLRFGLIDALARRAGAYDGAVRTQLEARLSQLLDDYAGIVQRHVPDTAAGEDAPSPLRQLITLLTTEPLQYQLPLNAAGRTEAAAEDTGDGTALPVLDEFQQLWGRIRIESLLRQCLDALPEDAGPLHSSVLTYRAMALMQEISPDYLQHFIAYVDVLTWMEPLSGNDTAPEPSRSASKRKAAPRKKKPVP